MGDTDALQLLQRARGELAAEAEALDPYDALCWAGYPPRAFRAWPDVAAVRAGLQNPPIRRALLSHTVGGSHDPEAGNRLLADMLRALPGVHGVATLVPETRYGERDVARRVVDLVRAGMRAVRLLPKSHRYALATPGVGEMLEALAARRIPLFLPIGQTSWNEAGALARMHPDLRVVVESAGHHEYLNMRAALPWLEREPNILVPTNRQFLAGGLELLTEQIGPERVLFASGQPIEDPWASLAILVKNRLPDDAKRRIAHGNLQDLLNGVVIEDPVP